MCHPSTSGRANLSLDHPPASDPRTEAILRDYAILEGGGEAPSLRQAHGEEFADVVKLAAQICEAPSAFLSFVGDEMQWLCARTGIDLESTPRNHSFCAYSMRGRDIMIVPDALRDQRFAANPYVTGEPNLRFYAGMPLISPDGIPLGAMCVTDTNAREGLTSNQAFGLRTLAAQVMERLESRRRAVWRSRVETTLFDLTSDAGFVHRLEWNVSPASSQASAADPVADVVDAKAIRAFLATVVDGDRQAVDDGIGQTILSSGALQIECGRATQEGSRRILIRARVIGDVDRRLVGLVTDVTAQRDAERLSAENEHQFRVLADTMPQMVWSTRADGFHDYYNARWYEFTGVPSGSTDGEEWNGMFHPDDQEQAWAKWRHSLATGYPYEIEYRLRHRSGQYRWTLGRALPMRDDEGGILRWFGTCTDIHEAKQIAEERELIAQELSHRIKNTFLVIAGLISLSARHDPSVRPFANELRDRVIALGRAHNFVRPHASHPQPAAGTVTLQNLLTELTEPYRLNGDPRFRCTGDDLAIDDRAATPIALLVHELATNAVKYGALSVSGGSVLIDFRVRGDRLLIVWTETGGPRLAEFAPTEGFGTRVTRLSVETQLGGRLQHLWRPEGLQVIADVPRASFIRMTQRPSVYAVVEDPKKTA